MSKDFFRVTFCFLVNQMKINTMNKFNRAFIPLFVVLMAGCSLNLDSENELLRPGSLKDPFPGGLDPTLNFKVDLAVHFLLNQTAQERIDFRDYYKGVINLLGVDICTTDSDVEIWTIEYMDAGTLQDILVAPFTDTFIHSQTPKTAGDGETIVFSRAIADPSSDYKVRFVYDGSCP